jgi:hypothetical protein
MSSAPNFWKRPFRQEVTLPFTKPDGLLRPTLFRARNVGAILFECLIQGKSLGLTDYIAEILLK